MVFNNAVDTTKAVFAVKRGTVTEDVTVTWNDAKTEASLKRSVGNFPAADYTVTVTGVETAEGKNIGTATVAEEKIESIEIATEQLQKSGTAPITINFINQYGKNATVAANDTNLTITAYNNTKGTAISQVAGKYELDASVADAKDEVRINVLYKTVSTTKNITVVAAATVGEVTLTEAVLPTGKTMFTPKGTTDVEVKYTAKNTLGEDQKLVAGNVGTTNSNLVKIISSDAAVLNPADVTVDGNNKMKIAKFGKAGTVTLTALSTATGKTSSIEIVVNENAGEPYAVTLEKTTVEFAAGSTTPFYVAMTVADKYDTQIAVKDLKIADYEMSVDNSSVAAAVFEGSVGNDYGKVKVTPAPGTTKGQSAVVTVLVKATGQKATFTVTANDAALPTSIDTKKDTTVSTSLLAGATQTLSYDVKDQYGTVLGAVGTYTVEYTTSDNTVLSITSDESGKDAINAASVDVKALKAGTVTFKAQLKKDGVAIAEKAYTITVGANDSTKVTYEIPAIAPVYNTGVDGVKTINNASGASAKKAAVESGYAEEVALQAKDASGNVSLVPVSAVANVSLTQAVKADGSAAAGALEWFEYNGKFYVVTKTDFDVSDFAASSGGSADLKAKITFTVSAEDTVKLVSQDITISKDAAVAQSVEFKSAAPGTQTATAVTELTINNLAGYTKVSLDGGATDGVAYIWAKDQFGGYVLSDDSAGTTASLFAVSGADAAKLNLDTVTFDESNGKIAIADTSGDKASTFTANNAKFRIIAASGDKTAFITVTMVDGILPVAGTPTAAAYDPTTGILKLTTTGASVVGDLVDVTKVKFTTTTGTPFTGANNFALTTSTGTVTSATEITITLSTDDKTELEKETTLANIGVTTSNGLLKDVAGNVSVDGAATLANTATTVTGE
ncbi:hypothetical protein [Desulfotomaculum sp. 1211_IL3151]|uniref:hypothetical protein n=1 Tax=Desulfotomaculum sp. 1211_IL3151 TaxID=3084055 RepID=UPI002FD9C2AA